MQKHLSLFILFFLVSFLVFGQSAGDDSASRLAGRAIGNTPLMSDLQELCDSIGGRITGTPACDRAIEWGVKKFKQAGLQSVDTESYTVPLLWIPNSAEASVTSPEKFSIRIAAAPFSPSTPSGGLEAKLVDAGEGTPEDYKKLAESARGAIALIQTKEMKTLGDLFAEYMRNNALMDAAQRAGVSAVLLQSTRPRGLLYRHPIAFGGSYSPMPVAVISREHAAHLARLAAQGEVRVKLSLQNKTGGAYESKNVIAEIRGTDKANEIVVLGAHLDSWELGTGAQDNGVNCALVIDVARAFQQLGLHPRRTIRFALFTGEEEGMRGSAGYVHRHAAEMDNHVAMVTFDIGSGKTTGFYLNGREELRKPINDILTAVAGLGTMDHSNEGVDGTDNYDFLLSGIPNLVANQDAAPYLPDYHAESDVYEMVDAREARAN
ncbi:MAG: peptidase M28, partial [Acidobacteria bacterium]